MSCSCFVATNCACRSTCSLPRIPQWLGTHIGAFTRPQSIISWITCCCLLTTGRYDGDYLNRNIAERESVTIKRLFDACADVFIVDRASFIAYISVDIIDVYLGKEHFIFTILFVTQLKIFNK